MKITQKRREADTISFDVVATASDVDQVFNRAHIAFANSMGMTPVPGKTVAQVAQEKMGINDLDSIVRENATEMLVPMVLDKKNIVPAFMPVLHGEGQLMRGREFRFHLDVAMKPNYELSSYEPIHLKVPRFTVDEARVDEEISKLQAGYTSYVKDENADPEHALQSGDYAKIALKVTKNGEEMKGLTTAGRTYAVGAGHMPPSFDEQVIGMKAGESKSFSFEAPSFDDNMQETTETLDAEVDVLELLKEVAPEIDDNWVRKNAPMFDNVEQFRANLRKTLEIEGREEYNAYIRQAAVTEIAKRFEGSIADGVYEQMVRQLREQLQMDLNQQGRKWEDFVEEQGGEQQLTMLMMLQARDVLTQGYALDAVFRHFGLTVTDADAEQVCRTMNPTVDPKQLHEQIRQNGQGFALRESVERFKANVYLVEHADIEYVE